MKPQQIAAAERRLEEHAAQIGAPPPEDRTIIAQDGGPGFGIIAWVEQYAHRAASLDAIFRK